MTSQSNHSASTTAAQPTNHTTGRDSTRPELSNLTSLIGREVYTKNGLFIGEVSDLRLSFDQQRATRLALDRVNTDLLDIPRRKSGILIPYRWVQNVGDIVVVADFVESLDIQSD